MPFAGYSSLDFGNTKAKGNSALGDRQRNYSTETRPHEPKLPLVMGEVLLRFFQLKTELIK
jgi:hypothetical protein